MNQVQINGCMHFVNNELFDELTTLREQVASYKETVAAQTDVVKQQEKVILTLEEKAQDNADDLNFLGCLKAAGVDNWEGYDSAQEMMEDD